MTKDQRDELYKEYEELLAKQAEKYKELGEKIEEEMKKESEEGETTTTIFVTLESSYAMKVLSSLNDPSINSKLRYYLSCCQLGLRFTF